jgi:hypothetical protein
LRAVPGPYDVYLRGITEESDEKKDEDDECPTVVLFFHAVQWGR